MNSKTIAALAATALFLLAGCGEDATENASGIDQYILDSLPPDLVGLRELGNGYYTYYVETNGNGHWCHMLVHIYTEDQAGYRRHTDTATLSCCTEGSKPCPTDRRL